VDGAPEYLLRTFGPGGYLSRGDPAYEMRESQVRLAWHIHQGVIDRRHTLAEAPTGTGKSLAYLVPAAYLAAAEGVRVVVATSTLALQEQVFHKDLPRLAAALPAPLTFAMLKGRSNYLCQRDLGRRFEGPPRDAEGRRLLAWANATKTGDRAELVPALPHPAWRKVSTDHDGCDGKDCPRRSVCFYERAKAKAGEAQVLVVNHHLLLAHLAYGRQTLPEFDVAVVDEAHDFADTARGFFERTLSTDTAATVRAAARDCDPDVARAALAAIDNALLELGQRHADRAGAARGPRQVTVDAPPQDAEASIEAIRALSSELERRAGDDAKNAVGALGSAESILKELAEPTGRWVAWTERDPQRRLVAVRSKPVDVSDFLGRELFGRCRSVALVSATLSANGDFGLVRAETGAPESAAELVVESPIRMEEQALLYLPDGVPAPDFGDRRRYLDAAVREVRAIVEAARGRTLVLCNSFVDVDAVAEGLSGCGYAVLRQRGDGSGLPKSELVAAFKRDVSSVLVGTESFWTGVDVPGEALSALVVLTLPFEAPNPVSEALKARDPAGFFRTHLLPQAVVKFRQGVGRLIRTRSDVGVVAVIDPRCRPGAKSYAGAFLKALGGVPRTRSLADVRRHLARGGRSAA
jgi:ATP-dependent DNA helicase DinG